MEGEDVKFVCSAVARSHPDFHLLKWKQPSNVSNGTDPFDFVDFTKSKYQEIRETAKQHTGNRKLYTHRFIVRNVTFADEARYTCMVGNSAGYVSHNVFLTIKTHDGRFIENCSYILLSVPFHFSHWNSSQWILKNHNIHSRQPLPSSQVCLRSYLP